MTKNTHKYYNVDFTGYRNGRLTVIRKADVGKSTWLCRCDCGNEVVLQAWRLLKNKSCGCLEKENIARLSEHSIKHGMTETRLYGIWCGIKNRCTNPNFEHYDRYGGRGIKMCDEWLNSFETFMQWSNEHGYDARAKYMSIDRIDVDGDYCPANCRWLSDRKEQNRNRSDTIYVTYNDGHKISAREFAEMHNFPNYHYVYRKAKAGKTAETILSEWELRRNTPSEYCSVDEAASIMHLSKESIYIKINSGIISAEKHGGRLYVRRDVLRR